MFARILGVTGGAVLAFVVTAVVAPNSWVVQLFQG